MPAPPGEAELLAFARRFEDAERRVRALLAQAVDGDRREALRQALLILVDLRRATAEAPQLVTAAYVAAHAAIGVLLDTTPAPPGSGVGNVGRTLAAQLDRAGQRAAEGSRRAFRAVTTENIEDASQEAVTGLVDRDGRRLALAGYATAVTAASARRATSRGTLDGLGTGGRVTYSSHGSRHPACAELEGQSFPADAAPRPPIHPGCAHSLIPDGYSEDDLAAAQTEAVRDQA